MPALGFDPALGDIGSANAVARRYAEIRAEVAAVQAQVADIDLTRWEGKAAAAAEQANHAYLATRAPHVPQLTGDLVESITALRNCRSSVTERPRR